VCILTPLSLFLLHTSCTSILLLTADETLKHEVLSILPLVRDATAIAEDLSKGYKFEVVIVSPLARGLSEGRNEVKVSIHNDLYTLIAGVKVNLIG